MTEQRSAITTEVLKARRANRKVAKLEKDAELKRTEGPWPLIERGVEDYGYSFDKELLGDDFSSYVTKVGEKPNAFVLDVMAEEAAVTELVKDYGFKGGLAINLGYEPKKTSFLEEGKVVSAINGDIFSKRTWEGVHSWLREHDKIGFDLIISRGAAALMDLPNIADIHYFLMQRMWSTLNPDGGTLLLQLPIIAEPNFRQWAEELTENNVPMQFNSVVNGFFDFEVLIKRQRNSPEILPIMIGAPIEAASKMRKVVNAELH